nr:unnamed protein product [Callosobruchus analis]
MRRSRLWVLRGRGQRLSTVPRVSASHVRGRTQSDLPVELHMSGGDRLQPGNVHLYSSRRSHRLSRVPKILRAEQEVWKSRRRRGGTATGGYRGLELLRRSLTDT